MTDMAKEVELVGDKTHIYLRSLASIMFNTTSVIEDAPVFNVLEKIDFVMADTKDKKQLAEWKKECEALIRSIKDASLEWQKSWVKNKKD
jgi:hypothetical protein